MELAGVAIEDDRTSEPPGEVTHCDGGELTPAASHGGPADPEWQLSP